MQDFVFIHGVLSTPVMQGPCLRSKAIVLGYPPVRQHLIPNFKTIHVLDSLLLHKIVDICN